MERKLQGLDPIPKDDQGRSSLVTPAEMKVEFFKTLLKNDIVRIGFKKVDGTESEMICTLLEAKLPASVSTKKVETKSSDTVRAFSIDRNGWRSFKVDNVTFYEILKG